MSTTPTVADPREPWQRELSAAVRDPAQLLAELQLPAALLEPARLAASGFGLMVTRSFLARMEPENPNDPLLRQVLPVGAELTSPPGFVSDPLQEGQARREPGLVQKYRSRVLLIAAGSCAINCRYCFRREYPYAAEPRRPEDWEPALQAIQSDESICEVILSGGDPLLLTNHRLAMLIDRLDSMPHITCLRIHSRLPIVLPSRLNPGLLELCRQTRLQTIFVVHANHPAEIIGDCAQGLAELVGAGLPTLNQTVLLRGINDDAATLVALSRRLIGLGVMPYYLHQLDRVTGTAHFEVPVERGRELIAEMRQLLPGYGVPRYVVEEPGAAHKTVLA